MHKLIGTNIIVENMQFHSSFVVNYVERGERYRSMDFGVLQFKRKYFLMQSLFEQDIHVGMWLEEKEGNRNRRRQEAKKKKLCATIKCL